jgi:hypothetical protein
LWWQEFILLTVFNLAWFGLQLLIVTGPPATAAMYAICKRVVEGDLIELQHGWEALRDSFVPAWKWGLPNLIIAVVVVGNFSAYHDAPGVGWAALRLVWAVVAVTWFSANLFYWPLWLAQEDRSFRTTVRNCFVYLAKQPVLAFSVVVISAILTFVSLAFTLPLAVGLMAWLALMGILAVEVEVKPKPG